MNESRILEVERRLEDMRYEIADLKRKLVEASQLGLKAWSQGGFGPSGAAAVLHWCRTPEGGVDAATGSWPDMTAATFEADVQRAGTLVATEARIYWRYPQGADQYKLVPCLPNGDGSYDAILDSCEEV